MNGYRTIKKVITGKSAVDGAGVNLIRVFGFHETKDFDPFLLMDAFDSDNPNDYIKGFPWHPHRGIETITYLIEGNIEHGDSIGNSGNILNGQCQWMTAGSGIIHQEMPQPSERMLGIQVWLNLASRDKMTAPKYRAISKEDIPVIDEENVGIHIIAGPYKGTQGAIQSEYTRAHFFDIELNAGARWILDTEEHDTVFVYVLMGEVLFDDTGTYIPEKHTVLFNEGNQLSVKASDKNTRILVLAGEALKEPIAWGGPIVMNTKEELDLAFVELDENTFLK